MNKNMKVFQYKCKNGTIEDIIETCPDCGSNVKCYHSHEGTRMVCRDKCQGYKVIASRGNRDEYFTEGDI